MLIFYLDNDLKVYKLQESQGQLSLDLFDFILRQDQKYLNLGDKFSDFWQNIWKDELQIKIGSKTEIFYILGPNSGFTDSRVIFIWLKTMSFFESKFNFFVTNIENSLILENLSSFLLKDLILKARSENNQNLVYSRSPSIGKKKV